MRTICINGASLAGRITGIERYVLENIRRIDKLAEYSGIEIRLLYPARAKMNHLHLSNIKIVPIKNTKNNKLNLVSIIHYLRKEKAVYFSLSGNICVQKGATICIPDIRPWIYSEYDPILFRLRCAINFISIKLRADTICTISETAKSEISRYLRVDPAKIVCVPCGWEHMTEYLEDDSIFDRIPNIQRHQYYYALSSLAPHKNFRWIEEIAIRNSQFNFIVGGKPWIDRKGEAHKPANVYYIGYVTDRENKALMKNCKAFLHPSKYEGFGIPPLEALSCGAPICVSNASCLPEIFGNTAHYFDPDDYSVNLASLLEQEVDSPDVVLKKYRWDKSAEIWMRLIIEASQKTGKRCK